MNTKIMLSLTVLAMVAGCNKPAESVVRTGMEFTVERLFTHEGCTVFRFEDGGSNRYFTRCDGIAAQSTTTWHDTTTRHESCGKGCTRLVEVSGGQP